jgi:hypothetical protein
MSMTPEQFDEIEKYIQGELAPSEKTSFEEKLTKDPVFAREVENHRDAIFFIKAGAVDEMKKKLETYSQLPLSPRKTSSEIFKRWYVWAAAASVVFIILVTLLIPREKSGPDKLFLAYFQPPKTDRQLLRDSSTANEKSQAFVAYSQGQYKNALLSFEKSLIVESSDELLFYAGASALADGQDSVAIFYFTELLKNPNTLYQRRTQWYLSLAYVKNNQLDMAGSLLTTLSEQPNSYTEQANQLLQELAR